MSKRPQRDPHLERRWRELLAQQQKSPLSIRAFCQAHALSESNFFAWRSEIARRDQAKQPSATPTFVPVRVTPTSIIEVVLPTGVIVRVPVGADPALIARLVAALGDPSC